MLQQQRLSGRDCRNLEHNDVFALAIHGIWISAIPAEMTIFDIAD
ncbi:MAG: hypothetical protein Q8R93_19850 [Methylicorpusculum sp.]|nr:hypothetical protein [Methylicorpusculum sp.]MDP3531559.1 hypothetical protein [Methylicorpusculum sp.]